jgi:hypothetical protein
MNAYNDYCIRKCSATLTPTANGILVMVVIECNRLVLGLQLAPVI